MAPYRRLWPLRILGLHRQCASPPSDCGYLSLGLQSYLLRRWDWGGFGGSKYLLRVLGGVGCRRFLGWTWPGPEELIPPGPLTCLWLRHIQNKRMTHIDQGDADSTLVDPDLKTFLNDCTGLCNSSHQVVNRFFMAFLHQRSLLGIGIDVLIWSHHRSLVGRSECWMQ